jgi:hypothetical protein
MKHINKFDDFVNESIGQERNLNYYAQMFFGLIMAPVVTPIWANFSTDKKIDFLVNTAIDNYYVEKAEYEILEDIKYDIEIPSKLNKIRKRLRLIEKRMKKWPTMEKYLESGFQYLKLSNIFNFKNREDVDYIIKKVKEQVYNKTEREWIDEIKRIMVYDEDKGRVVYISEAGRNQI